MLFRNYFYNQQPHPILHNVAITKIDLNIVLITSIIIKQENGVLPDSEVIQNLIHKLKPAVINHKFNIIFATSIKFTF